ncbi:MAG: cupin domain-containing protein [Burkholderiales bacterium]|nr:cupin domain-containing protein [Burkholderiales bacterium]
MQRRKLKPGEKGFEVIAGTGRTQVARMVLGPNESTGGPENAHAKSDQWLYVLGGAGHAIVGGRSIPLKAGALLLIEAGEPHEIVNDRESELQTLNFYAPPAY